MNHTVKRGDTLLKLAKQYNVPLPVILELNDIADPDRIYVGQIIDLPAMETDGMVLDPAKASLIQVPTINRTRFRFNPGDYFQEIIEKDLIVLHFTAGSSVAGAFQSWLANATRIGTAYIIDRTGDIFEIFPPECWAYHLGMKTGNPRHIHDRRSIGIELVNVGPLQKRGSELCFWPKGFTSHFCFEHESEKYAYSHHKGMDYWSRFPKEQYDALNFLLNDLAEKFPGIDADAVLRPTDPRPHWKGITSHEAFRRDKFDLGPAFTWERLLTPSTPERKIFDL